MMVKLTYFLSDFMKVKIKVGNDYNEFQYDGDLNITVTSLLEKLGDPVGIHAAVFREYAEPAQW